MEGDIDSTSVYFHCLTLSFSKEFIILVKENFVKGMRKRTD